MGYLQFLLHANRAPNSHTEKVVINTDADSRYALQAQISSQRIMYFVDCRNPDLGSCKLSLEK